MAAMVGKNSKKVNDKPKTKKKKKKTKQNKTKKNMQKIEPEKLLEPLTVETKSESRRKRKENVELN